jgi:hypothetical protein
MAENQSVPYVLADREIPDAPAPDNLEVHPAPCIFCGTPLRHVNDGGNGSSVRAVVDGVANEYMRCSEGPCSLASAPWIWRCGCMSEDNENVGDYCGACGRHRRLAKAYDRVECPFCEDEYGVDDRDGIGRHDACPDCAEPFYRPVPYEIPPLSIDTNPKALCQALLDAAEEHGLANGDYEMAWGDVEELFRAAFAFLTPEQLDRFWEDGRVAGLVGDCPEYETIAEAVYGPLEEEDEDEEKDEDEEEAEDDE